MSIEAGKRAVGIILKGENILLIHRFHPGWQKGWYYVFPGGGVEDGETPEEAVIREIKEELSVDVEIDRLLFVEHNPSSVRGNENGRDEYFYLIREFEGEPELGGPEKERMHENDQFILEWIPIKNMSKMENLFPEKAKKKLIKFLE